MDEIDFYKNLEENGIEEVIRRKIASWGTSCHIAIPRHFLNKDAIVIIKK